MQPQLTRPIAIALIMSIPLIWTFTALADDPVQIAPGSRSIKGNALKEHVANYQLFARTDDGQEQPMQEIQREAKRRGDLLVIQWTTEARGMEVKDEVVVDAQTLAPVSAAMPSQKDEQMVLAVVDFDGAKITGHWQSQAGEELEKISSQLERSFFMGSTDALLLLALDLEEGAAFTWPTAAHTFDAVSWTTARVLGRESVPVGGRSIEGWLVALETDLFQGKVVVADREPYVLKKEFDTPQFTLIWRIKD